jgi:cytochrome d ubiquinol oxidase subunit I
MFPRPFWHQTSHAILACYQATAFALAAIHAAVLLAHPTSALFKKALGITLAIATVTALIQPVVGHASAQAIAKHEPTKLAAAEGLYETMPRAPLALGGIYDETTGKLRGAIEIPGGLSFLSFNDVDAVVQGLDAVPPDERPPVNAVHWSFDLMVGSGSAMALLGVVAIVLAWRRRGVPTDRWFLKCVVAAGPLGLVALETGWFVTELGRQPWIVRGFMRTADAVTPFSHMTARFWLFAIVYVFLGVTVVFLLWRQLRAAPVAASPDAPPQSHGPHGAGASP